MQHVTTPLPPLRRLRVALGASASLLCACSLAGTPSVKVNQLGYLPSATKIGIVTSSAKQPLDWRVIDVNGAVVASGKTQVSGNDEDSGDDVHQADFSSVTRPGKGYQLVVDGESSYGFAVGPRVYEALEKSSLNFFYQNRSGTPIEIPWAGAWQWTHGPGHLSDADVACIDDCGYTLNVLGGWYDAGDHGKYVVNGGISTAQLLSTHERSQAARGARRRALGDGSLSIPEQGNGVPDVLDEARWELEWMLSMQVPSGAPLEGMVHHKVHDNQWTALPMDPARDPALRELHRPSTAATLNMAAAAAQGARLYGRYDRAFAQRLLQLVRERWHPCFPVHRRSGLFFVRRFALVGGHLTGGSILP